MAPLFFNIVINGLPEAILNSLSELFADDTKIFREIGNLTDSVKLQQDFDRVIQWSVENLLPINVAKTVFMSYYQSNRGRPFDTQYYYQNCVITRAEQVSDLGIKFDAQLKFSNHICHTLNHCYKLLGFIFRMTRSTKDIDLLVLLYNSLIRSKLEFCAVLWYPDSAKERNKIEHLQTRFVRLLFYKINGFYPSYPTPISYDALLEHLDLDHFSGRVTRQRLFFIYKILNSLTEDPRLLASIGLRVTPPGLRARPNNFFSTANLGGLSKLAKCLHLFNNDTAPDPFLPLQSFTKALQTL